MRSRERRGDLDAEILSQRESGTPAIGRMVIRGKTGQKRDSEGLRCASRAAAADALLSSMLRESLRGQVSSLFDACQESCGMVVIPKGK